MKPKLNILPMDKELPSAFANRLSLLFSSTLTKDQKKKSGQFFTPLEIASFMSSLSSSNKDTLKILDPGSGTAILSCTLIESFLTKGQSPDTIKLIAYENDKAILPYLTLSLLHLKTWLAQRNVAFFYEIKPVDFILENKNCFNQDSLFYKNKPKEQFDIVISNPPYFKIAKNDPRAKAAHSFVHGQPNIYSLFLIAASRLLKPGGELITITPRSFSSGKYFQAFRASFFNEIHLEQIHLFNSRTETFYRDNVLQETIIMKGKRKATGMEAVPILLSHSQGITDIADTTKKTYNLDQLINLSTKDKILHLPANERDDATMALFRSWRGSLQQYGIQISTGPVVAFRAKQFLYEHYKNGVLRLVPLFQLHNTVTMGFHWPMPKKGKPQYIESCEQTQSFLLPNKNYIFLRRFSTKDDKHRLVATPYFASLTEFDHIGVENHLNYIYRPNGHLNQNEILGLAALLNSKLFDIYFRTFNGNINVSATELREMPLPPLEIIQQIGKEIISLNNTSLEHINNIVTKHFHLNSLLSTYE